jgi:hypothetical protein
MKKALVQGPGQDSHRPDRRLVRLLTRVVAVGAVVLGSLALSPGAASADASNGATTVAGPNGAAMSSMYGGCSSANHTIYTGLTLLTPATGYTRQYVRMQMIVRDRYTGVWASMPWTNWSLTTSTGALFNPYGFAPFTSSYFHTWDVVIRGQWYFSDGTTRTQDMYVRYFMNYSGGVGTLRTYCSA